MVGFIFAFSVKGLRNPPCREHLLERWVSAAKYKFHFTLPQKFGVTQNSQVLILFRARLGPWNKSYLPSHSSCLFNTHSVLSLLITSQPLAHMWQRQLKHMQQTCDSKLLGSATQDNLKEQKQISYHNNIFSYMLCDNVHCDLNPPTVKFFESLNTWYPVESLLILEMFWHFGSK